MNVVQSHNKAESQMRKSFLIKSRVRDLSEKTRATIKNKLVNTEVNTCDARKLTEREIKLVASEVATRNAGVDTN